MYVLNKLKTKNVNSHIFNILDTCSIKVLEVMNYYVSFSMHFKNTKYSQLKRWLTFSTNIYSHTL